MRIATWNVNSLKARLDRVEHWLGARQPEILCIQETKLTDDAFPALTFQALGYETVHHGQGQWNGVAILSRIGIADVRAGFEDEDDPDAEARLLWAQCGDIRVGTMYVPNGREVGHDHYEYKLRFLDRVRAQLERHEDRGSPLVLCGDFNIAPEDRDVWDPEAFVGATHVSEPERERFRALVDWGLIDSFRQLDHDDGRFTWWDYRGGNFHKKMGMRIDHLLVSPALGDRLTAIEIDREERKPKGNPAGGAPSDHAPLIATFD